MYLKIDRNKCTGCSECVTSCPFGAIELRGALASEREGCTGCGICANSCPFGAITLAQEEGSAGDNGGKEKPGGGVWVYIEHFGGGLAGVTKEMIATGRRLADDLNTTLSAVLLGNEVGPLAQELLYYDIDLVYAADHPELKIFRTEPYTRVIAGVARRERPEVLLMGATTTGRDLAPRLAARLGTGLTADCTELTVDKENRRLLQTRPAFGGNLLATIVTRGAYPQMATVRPGVMGAAEKSRVQKGLSISVPVELEQGDTRVGAQWVLQELKQIVKLEECDVIVSGGRGVGSPEGFKMLEELAGLLGGQVGGSRLAVERGWVGAERQVGQTGKSVRPKLYIACGISGAVQHVVGMSGARYVVAVNTDRYAPIFNAANLGIVADCREVVGEWIKLLRGTENNNHGKGAAVNE